MEIKPVTEQKYRQTFTLEHPTDTFAKHFIYRAGVRNYWAEAMGCWEGNRLLGALIMTATKREPKTANMQLLHVFVNNRGRGIGRVLCNHAFSWAVAKHCAYFRISALPNAVKFYEAVGIKFWGKQKWGYSLSIFRIEGDSYQTCIYDDNDPFIFDALYSGKPGSLWLTID